MRKFIVGAGYALRGIYIAIRDERNMKIHLVAATLALTLSSILALPIRDWLFVLMACVLVITLEMVNTAIERLADAVSEEHHPLIGLAKDVSAGAVLLAAIFSVVVGGVILGPPLFRVVSRWFVK